MLHPRASSPTKSRRTDIFGCGRIQLVPQFVLSERKEGEEHGKHTGEGQICTETDVVRKIVEGRKVQTESAVPPGGKVIVIGAGFSGIAAACALKEAGYDVTILEARDRIGGRVRTDRRFGTPIDLGASWLHGGAGNPLKPVAKALGVKTRVSDYGSLAAYRLDTLGRLPIRQEDLEHERARLDSALYRKNVWPYYSTMLRRWLGLAGTRVSVADVLGKLSFHSTQAGRFALCRIEKGIEGIYAAPAQELSFANLLYESATDPEGKSLPQGEQFILGGMDALIDHFAEAVSVQFGQTVKRISYGVKGVQVKTEREVFSADGTIVTVSIGLLRSGRLSFDPELPQSHQTALSRMDMGLLNKVILRFPRAFWPEEADFLFVCGDTLCPFYVNFAAYARVPILVGLSGGTAAHEIEELSDQAIVARLCKELSGIMGDAVPDPTDVIVQRWRSDPFALGSYAYLRVGANGGEPKVLSRPVAGRVFFAGEALHPHDPGTVHGAYWSGQRAAWQVQGA